MIAMSMPTNGTGAFVGGADGGSTYADFDQAYDAVNASNSGNGTARYTVRQGDTLQSIAASLFGDASLWYIIGEANGLTSTSALSAGQSLTVPGKISNFHNNADTFRPYDASKAIGDTAPTTPRPPKKANGCGVFGQILLAAVAIAVTAIIAPAGAPLLTQIGAAVAGSVVSQGVGLATGIQDKFSFKGVALAALSAGVSGGLDKLGNLAQAGKIGGGLAKASKFLTSGSQLANFARGALTNVLTQGVATVTGLQQRFDFTGVAAGSLATGVGGFVRGGASDFGTRFVSGLAGGIAGAGARSLVTGTNFGDNVIAVLPDVIGATIGSAIAGALTNTFETRFQKLVRNNVQFAEARSDTVQSDSSPDIIVTGKRFTPEEQRNYDLDQLSLSTNRLFRDFSFTNVKAFAFEANRTLANYNPASVVFRAAGTGADAIGVRLGIGRVGTGLRGAAELNSGLSEGLGNVAGGIIGGAVQLISAPRATFLGAVRGLAGGIDRVITARVGDVAGAVANGVAELRDFGGRVIAGDTSALRSLGVNLGEAAGTVASLVAPVPKGLGTLRTGEATRFAGTTNIGVEIGAATRASQIASVNIGQALGATRSAEFIGPTIGRSRFAGPGEFAEIIGQRVQSFTDGAFPRALADESQNLLPGLKNTRVGTRVDQLVSARLRQFLNAEGIAEGQGQLILINRRLYDPTGSGAFVRPDVRVPSANRIFEVTIADKQIDGNQLQGFLNFGNDFSTIVKPQTLPTGGSFSLVR